MVPIVHMDSAGAIVDTIYSRPWSLGRRDVLSIGSGQVPLPEGPSAGPRYLDAPNGRYVVEWSVPATSGGAVFVVTRIVGAADTVFQRTFRYQPRPYDEETVARFVTSAVAPFIASTGLDTAAVVAIVQRELEWPSFQPPITDGWVGQDTTLWLKSESSAPDSNEWIRISPAGIPLGRLVLDKRTIVLWSKGAEVWTSRHDEFDIPWLVKYRVRGID
jgi:hypothetical protein